MAGKVSAPLRGRHFSARLWVQACLPAQGQGWDRGSGILKDRRRNERHDAVRDPAQRRVRLRIQVARKVPSKAPRPWMPPPPNPAASPTAQICRIPDARSLLFPTADDEHPTKGLAGQASESITTIAVDQHHPPTAIQQFQGRDDAGDSGADNHDLRGSMYRFCHLCLPVIRLHRPGCSRAGAVFPLIRLT